MGFKLQKGVKFFNRRQLSKVNEKLVEAQNEQDELLAKAAKKKKSPSKKKAPPKKGEPEEPEEEKPPGDPYLMAELRDVERAERHEWHQQHLIEAMAIKQHLASQ